MQFNKLYLSISLLLIGAIWVACVDVPSGPGTNPNPDFRSMARFVNAIPGSPAANISIDGTAAGSAIPYLGNSGYLDVASGSRQLSFNGSTALTQAFGSEQQSSIAIYRALDGTTAYLNLVEGDYKKNNGVSGVARIKFVNVASGSSQNVAFKTDSITATTISAAYGAVSQYRQYDPGTRTVYAISGGTYKSTINGAQVVPTASGSASTGSALIDLSYDSLNYDITVKSKNSEGMYTSAAIFNGAEGASGDSIYAVRVDSQKVSFQLSSLTAVSASTGTALLSLSSVSGVAYNISLRTDNSGGLYTGASFHNAPVGQNGPAVFTISVDSQRVSFPTATLSGANEVPQVTTSSTGTGTFSLSSKKGLDYLITVTSDNSQGFYTAAHFHNAAAGANGSVVKAISVAKQRMTFPSTSLSGANEVPPVTTTASGTATFTLWRDSLQFSITVTRTAAATDTPFTAAHFHLGAAGTTGPVVRTIRSTSWNDVSRTFTGTWKSTDTVEVLTPALVDAIRGGLVYVNVHSPANPSGVIRAQLVPDATTANTYSGNWNDSTLTLSMKNELAFGRVYANFHTAANPAGQIRAQLVPDAFTTNTYLGTWNNAALTLALKNEWAKGNIYVNFLTVPNPSGDARAQAVPDTFTTNQYKGRFLRAAVPDSFRNELNRERMYVSFRTTDNPNGNVRGQALVDSSRGGRYRDISLSGANFESGRMYTVLAVGSGSNFQLLSLNDRQLGVNAKPSGAPDAVNNSKKQEEAKTTKQQKVANRQSQE